MTTTPVIKPKISKWGLLWTATGITVLLILLVLGSWRIATADWGFSPIFLTVLLLGAGIALITSSKVPAGGKKAGASMLFAGIVLAVIIYIFGTDNVKGWRQAAREATAVGTQPISKEEQARHLERERQKVEVASVRAVNEAKAKAEAEALAQLAKEEVDQLVREVKVPHCKEGWSEPVLIPAGWYMKYSWAGRSMGVQYLQDGVWHDALVANVQGDILAFRFCTTSEANLNITGGVMSLSWRKLK